MGSPGAGKTTFAQKLAKKTRLPLIHLDYHYHQKQNNYYHDKEAWVEHILKLMIPDKWIIDGNYGRTIPQRFKQADTIIFLDYPTFLCAYRVLRRWFLHKDQRRKDMPKDWNEEFSIKFLKYVLRFKRNKRPSIVNEIQNNQNKKVIIFKTSRAANKFLQTL